jgi:CheY-like chemotaxis protein
MDIRLPDMDGFAAARKIRQLQGGSAIVIVALTGWGHDEVDAQPRQAWSTIW